MMKRQSILFAAFAYLIIVASHHIPPAFASNTQAANQAANQAPSWEGIWFTCEFAQRQRAPDDGCRMFDDEGFAYEDGRLFYLKVIGSTETACRGNKVGQCFRRDIKSIAVSRQSLGKMRIEDNRLIVRYWGCEQSYQLFEGADFMTVKPLGKNCLWSQERHFYIAPFDGDVHSAP